VPGLDPVSVEGVRVRPGDLFEVAHVQDSQDRRWVVKAPRTAAAGAMLDDIAALSGLLGRRLDVAMPMVRGHAPVAEGRAAVYLRVPGRPLDFGAMPPGPLAEAVGRTLAHIHNVEHLLFEEAGRPSYDAESHRRRQLSELDRAAATGHVPTDLLTRWERRLEDVSLWRFAPSPVHGTFTGANVLASFDDEQDAGSGHVRGVLAWEESRIGDPADDFADLVARAAPDTLDSVLESYARSRVERPDAALVARARLAAEMTPLRTLLRALSSGELALVERTADRLRDLDERIEQDDARHAREDAARSERSRRASEQAARAAALDPDDPEAGPAPEWDATQPHHPFPMLAETQAVAMAGLLADDRDDASPPEVQPAGAPPPPASGPAVTPDPESEREVEPEDAPPPPSSGLAVTPEPQIDAEAGAESDAVTVPFVAPGHSDTTFEIDEVEALPDDDGGLLDLHEGASDFIPVEPHRPRDHRS
jgi:macrolide phosphotransferase